jgi:hypothetical protein
VIAPDASAGFVAAMEDVLATYQKPRNPDRPLACLDETSKQLIVETRTPIPAKPGKPARHDYEYERNSVANLFMSSRRWRAGAVTHPRLAPRQGDRSSCRRRLRTSAERNCLHVPSAEKIVLVQDNLSTHTSASLYATFPAAEARRLAMTWMSLGKPSACSAVL